MSDKHPGNQTGNQAGWTRRDFVRTASVLGPAAMTGRALGAVKNDRPLRVGLIGCGSRGSGAAVQALTADKNSTLVAVADIFADHIPTSLKAITGQLGEADAARVQVPAERQFVGFDAYQKLIDSGVDVVLMAQYQHFRPQHLAAAVAAGKHVFAEKPLAVDGPGIRSVLATAQEAERKKLSVVVGFCWRYHDGMRAFQEQVSRGLLGEVVNVQTTYHTGTVKRFPRKPEWTDLEFQLRNWWHFTWLSGDHVVEQAIHSIDRLSWAMGNKVPQRVTCLGGRAARSGPEQGNVFDHFSAVYEFEGGKRGVHTCRQIDDTPRDYADYVYGTKAMATLKSGAAFTVTDYRGKTLWSYDPSVGERNMYQTEHDELFASIRSGKPLNDCARGARSTLAAIAARMAAYTGQSIAWEQALESQEDLTPPSYAFGPIATPEVAIPGRTKFI